MRMQKITLFGLCCVGIFLTIVGCQNEKTNNPISSSFSLGEEQMQTGVSQQPGEDIAGSEVDAVQYPEGTSVIVALGDSITYGQGSSVGGYPALLQEKLLAAGYTVKVLNEGIRGERSYATHARWLEDIANADISLIMIGTNDVLNPGHCHEPYNCRTIEYIESMINEALISKKIPIVSTIPPAKTDDVRAWANVDFRALNVQIKELATQYNIPIVDSYEAIHDNGGNSLYSDYLHFNDQGYDIIAQHFYDAVVEGSLIEAGQQ